MDPRTPFRGNNSKFKMNKFKIQNLLLRFLPLKGVGGSLLFLVSCSGIMSHKAVREAAESYYSMLIQGDYKGFVNGYADAENMPEGFRSQLEDATAQFMASDDMRSLVNVSALSDSIGEDSTAYVKLQLQFSDSTLEQIEVPLILMEDGWKMWAP